MSVRRLPSEQARMDDTKSFLLWLTAYCAAVLAIVGGFVFFHAIMEAAAYRRVTGKDVTTWDAIWLDLRVQEPVK